MLKKIRLEVYHNLVFFAGATFLLEQSLVEIPSLLIKILNYKKFSRFEEYFVSFNDVHFNYFNCNKLSILNINSGKRIMGMSDVGALATRIMAKSYLSWNVPDEWSLEEAVTIPIVYATMLYGLCMASTNFLLITK